MAHFTLSSSAFSSQGPIPSKYTCEGKNVSPPLTWTGAPAATRSFALIVEDPDAPDPANPKTVWVHWILYNIPAEFDSLPEHLEKLPPGVGVGVNDWHKKSYGGPCPPIGRHRYFHRLFALDRVLPDLKAPNKATLEKVMQGHILAEAQLIGTFAAEDRLHAPPP